ncbi:MAG: hypothetical protein KDH91_16735, partial [Rhodoferax sp.]|nr:hypothetical protein [Rhodoferax sp.]MCB2043983.1 hypothetical protein [Rhodoferax sp.]
MGTPATPLAKELIDQLDAIALAHPPPRIAGLHVPADLQSPSARPRDAAFCAIELEDGAFGLSYLLLGDTVRQWMARDNVHAGTQPLRGRCP